MINDEADKVIEELFKSIQNTYQNKLEKSMKGSKFVFDYVHCKTKNICCVCFKK